MNYHQFKAEDFIMDKSFQQYCLQNNEEAVKFWTTWIEENSDKRAEVAKAKELYFILNGFNTSEEFQNDKAVFVDRLKRAGILNQQTEKPVAKPGRYRMVYRVATAAAIVVVLSTSALLLLKKSSSNSVAHTPAKNAVQNDVAPGGDKAILTLADGTKIVLDSAANGSLTEQGGVKVIKLDGQLAYKKDTNTTEVLYNTITTPNGGQYQLVLADGSKVWLNAASSLRFPTAFIGLERTVELTGEGYFEVTHDAQKSFLVKVNDVEVKVLGTHFNINAYEDEELVRTTLLQGKVKVTKSGNSLLLNPGQQAASNRSSEAINMVNDVDVDDVVAWKDGLFNFEHSDINKILREFARWYDVEIQANGALNGRQQFFGIISRNTSLASAIKVLKSGSTDIQYRIEGRKLIVQAVNKN